jgi:hypothetical protein
MSFTSPKISDALFPSDGEEVLTADAACVRSFGFGGEYLGCAGFVSDAGVVNWAEDDPIIPILRGAP